MATTFKLVRDCQIGRYRSDGTRADEPLPFPEEFGSWLLVGSFRHAPLPRYLQEHTNCGVLLATLQLHCGRRSVLLFSAFVEGSAEKDPEPEMSFVAVDPANAKAVEIATDLMEQHENGEHLSDEAFWAEADKHVQAYWAQLPLGDRLNMVLDSRVPPAIATSATIPDGEPEYAELWTMLYQEIGL